jgi:hypothetical protein
MTNLIERLNTGILEDKGIWKEYFVPTQNEIFAAYFEIDFCKEYVASNGLKIYHICICGEQSISVFKNDIKVKTIKEITAVEKQVSYFDKLTFVGNVTMKMLTD